MNVLRSLYTLSLSVFAATVLVSCGDSADDKGSETRPRLVRTTIVTDSGQVRMREFPGVVEANQKAALSFRVAGKISAIEVNESDEVSAEQALARMDSEDFRIRVDSARADYDRATADYERAEKLIGDGYISQTDYDNLKAQFENANAQLEAAERDLASTVLKAPFSGVVAKRHVENFEEVNAKQEILTLHDISSLLVRIDVPESVMILASRDTEDKQLTASFDAIPDQTFPLTFKEASSQPDEANGTYRVSFSMPALHGRLILPGMTVTVHAETPMYANQDSALILPPGSVMEDQSGRFVWIAVPTDSGLAKISRKPVTTGQLSAEGIAILSGVDSGDQVVTAGMSLISNGQTVRLEGHTGQ
jgi:RND family efflux transporter MFP subunit